MTDDLPHSAHYFGDQRDFWWNFDFLELMAQRWDMKSHRSVLDVGCGVGHWGLTLAPFMDPDCQVIGIDPERKWIANANDKAAEKGETKRFQYQVGRAEKIPFADNTFDMVTCQTVLIHVADVAVALKEMLRVLKPGGLLAVAEPNNIAPTLVFSNLTVDESIEEIFENIRFQLMCERGKKSLGLGYNSVGDIMPDYFSKQNLQDIQVYLSDKTSALIPPYSTKEQQILVEQIKTYQADEVGIWPQEEAKRYFLAGGGTLEAFQSQWSKWEYGMKEHQKNIAEQKLCSPGTCIMYLISGRKGS